MESTTCMTCGVPTYAGGYMYVVPLETYSTEYSPSMVFRSVDAKSQFWQV